MATAFLDVRRSPLLLYVWRRLPSWTDWPALIANGDAPPEIKSLVTTVVRRTGLWRSEKADVAAELLAHFSDATAAGVSTGESISAFGDIHEASRLIRRAKIRNRSWAWHLLRWMRFATILLLISYGLLAIVYFASHPTPTRNYVAEFNRRIEHTPASDRAWPIYVSASNALLGKEWPKVLDYSPDGKHWPEISKWTAAHEESIELIRQASERPSLGDPLTFPDLTHRYQQTPHQTRIVLMRRCRPIGSIPVQCGGLLGFCVMTSLWPASKMIPIALIGISLRSGR